jgi:hypothetical protein
MVILVIESAVDRLLASVELCGALVVPTVCVAKVKVVGDTTTPVAPLPVRLTVWGLFVALSTTVMDPLTAPVLVGLNVTEIVQFLPALTLVPQVFV